jgi:hypothetical protein
MDLLFCERGGILLHFWREGFSNVTQLDKVIQLWPTEVIRS